jgi:hypothetical protein
MDFFTLGLEQHLVLFVGVEPLGSGSGMPTGKNWRISMAGVVEMVM